MYDVLIVGCGVTGAAAAFALSRYKLRVGILERENDVAEGATKANSAIIHAGYDPKPGSLMAKLNVRGVELTRELARKLDVPYRPCGSLVLGFGPEDDATLRTLYDRGVQNGVPGLQLLSADEVHAMEPNLAADVSGALYAPSAAIISPWEFCLAMAECAVKSGAELHRNTAVTGAEKTSDGWTLHTSTGDYTARYVLNAAGLGAEALHNLVAAPTFHQLPARGEYYLLDKSEGSRVEHTIFQCPGPAGKGILVSPTVHGNLIVGPNAERVEGNETATTAAGLAFVKQMAAKSVPSINYRDSIRNFAGVRSNTDRGDFIIEWAAPGFLDLAGICSPGLSSAAAIGEYAVTLLAEDGLGLEPNPNFCDTRRRVRFKELSTAERQALVEREPAYGRVICRCETVTEGEILAALHTPIPPRTVDGVKRRVNAGMGRCQGGFCGPRVVELLSRELGVTPDKIEQDKQGTWLLVGETKKGANGNV